MYVKIPKKDIEQIKIVKTDCKLTLAQVVAKYKPDYAINGGQIGRASCRERV